MRKVPTPSGPLAFQLYFEDLGEIDEICLEALKSQSLLPSEPAPIRIERFVEKQFKTALRYEDLGPDNLGCTIFNSSGAVEAILISRFLEEQNTIPARRRVRSTVAHEAGHGLLHGSLFVQSNTADLANGPLETNMRRILCRSEDVLVDTPRVYGGRWWEFQANQAIGSLLLPSLLVNAFLAQSKINGKSARYDATTARITKNNVIFEKITVGHNRAHGVNPAARHKESSPPAAQLKNALGMGAHHCHDPRPLCPERSHGCPTRITTFTYSR